eukprot:8015804-Pyramimonas_sp.AAC.1
MWRRAHRRRRRRRRRRRCSAERDCRSGHGHGRLPPGSQIPLLSRGHVTPEEGNDCALLGDVL